MRFGISLIAVAGLCVMIRVLKPKRSVLWGLLGIYTAAVLIITLGLRGYIRQTTIYVNPFLVYKQAIRAALYGWKTGGWSKAVQFFGWHRKDLADDWLNVVLFIPLGFFAPLMSERLRRWGRVLLAGFGCSLLIEITQFITHRGWFDISDLFHNSLGALVGFWIWRKWLRESVKEK